MWWFPKELRIRNEHNGIRLRLRFPRHWDREHNPNTGIMLRDRRTDTVLQLLMFPVEPRPSLDELDRYFQSKAEYRERSAVAGTFQTMAMASETAWGRYFVSQDRQVKPGGHAWAAEGLFIVRECVFDFRILSHRPPPNATAEAFEILEQLEVLNPA